MKAKITIGILIFGEAEELDFVGPFEVFGMAAEFGEACQAILHYRELMSDQRRAKIRAELVQVAAVAVAAIEHLDEES